jgi:hypothetical protein
MCVSKNGPVYGLKLWYQSISFEISIVIVFGSFLAAMRAQWMACCKFVALWGVGVTNSLPFLVKRFS